MFTVIICSKAWLESVKHTCAYILELIRNDADCAVCEWDPDADAFEDSLPDLQNLIAGKPKWRAVVIQDASTFGLGYINKRNPFDIVGSVGALPDFGEAEILRGVDGLIEVADGDEKAVSAIAAALGSQIEASEQKIHTYRTTKQEHYKAALATPLAKLGVWLYGIPAHSQPEYPQAWPDWFRDDTVPIDAQYYYDLYSHRFLASEIEQYHVMRYRYDTMSSAFLQGALVSHKPEMILAISERDARCADEVFKTSAEHHEELEYSNFCDDNLYSDKMRFLFFDVHYENDVRSASDFLSFASLVALYAQNELPSGALRGRHVYKTDVVLDADAVMTLFERYLTKLNKTKALLLNLVRKHKDARRQKNIPEEEAVALFESNVTVPVNIRTKNDTNEFMAQYKKIGLATDCPIDSYHYWYRQATTITQKFIRYLREPRRAVKIAVKGDLRDQNSIDDERVWNLDEFQVQNVQLKLQDDEKKLMESATVQLFNTKEFTKQIEEADQNIRRGIFQRITRRKTWIVGLVAALAYLIGFLPMVFSNLNTIQSFLFSLMLTGILTGAFLGVGFLYLFVLRHRLINRFKHFNYVMTGMLNEIDNGLKAFSRYISCMCNIMREFSVLKRLNEKEDKQLNVLRNHIRDVENKIGQANELISSYDMGRWAFDEEVEPYAYDFTRMTSYDYDMPYTETSTRMEFLLKGHEVESSLDYVSKITIEREELYD